MSGLLALALIAITVLFVGFFCIVCRHLEKVCARPGDGENPNENLNVVRQTMTERRRQTQPADEEMGQAARKEKVKSHLFTRKIEGGAESIRTLENVMLAAEDRYQANTEGNVLSRSYRAAASSVRTFVFKPECVICLDEYKDGETICWARTHECDHIFHEECILEWLKCHDECPLCRANIMKANVLASSDVVEEL